MGKVKATIALEIEPKIFCKKVQRIVGRKEIDLGSLARFLGWTVKTLEIALSDNPETHQNGAIFQQKLTEQFELVAKAIGEDVFELLNPSPPGFGIYTPATYLVTVINS